MHVVSAIEAHEKQSYLIDLHWQEVMVISQYMQNKKLFDHAVPLIHTLLIKFKIPAVAISEVLFRTIVENFEYLPSDEVRLGI